MPEFARSHARAGINPAVKHNADAYALIYHNHQQTPAVPDTRVSIAILGERRGAHVVLDIDRRLQARLQAVLQVHVHPTGIGAEFHHPGPAVHDSANAYADAFQLVPPELAPPGGELAGDHVDGRFRIAGRAHR